MKLSTTKLHFILLMMTTATLFSGCAGLRCYKCEGDKGSESCAAFSRARSAYVVRHLVNLFEVECSLGEDVAGVQQFCYKFKPSKNNLITSTETRGCRVHASHGLISVGCDGEACLCDTDLCNDAADARVRYGTGIFILTLLASIANV